MEVHARAPASRIFERPWPGLAAAAVLAAVVTFPVSAPAAQECSWGQPGYRTCVENKIKEKQEQEAGKAPKQVYKTVPANKRPGTLTPVPDIYARERPRSRILVNPENGDAVERLRGQRQFQSRPPPMPTTPIYPNPELFPIPGRVCPTGGCS